MTKSRAAETRTVTRQALKRALSEAFPVLFARLKGRFKDAQLAEEVSHDCLTQAFELWQKDPSYFARNDLTAWSSTRANWRAIDRLRSRGRVAALPEERFLDEDRPAPALLDRRDHDRLDDRARTWEAIGRLDVLDQKILIGHYYDGRSDQDLGTELFGQSGSRIARGLRVWRIRQKAQARLRDVLLASGVDPESYAGQAV